MRGLGGLGELLGVPGGGGGGSGGDFRLFLEVLAISCGGLGLILKLLRALSPSWGGGPSST